MNGRKGNPAGKIAAVFLSGVLLMGTVPITVRANENLMPPESVSQNTTGSGEGNQLPQPPSEPLPEENQNKQDPPAEDNMPGTMEMQPAAMPAAVTLDNDDTRTVTLTMSVDGHREDLPWECRNVRAEQADDENNVIMGQVLAEGEEQGSRRLWRYSFEGLSTGKEYTIKDDFSGLMGGFYTIPAEGTDFTMDIYALAMYDDEQLLHFTYVWDAVWGENQSIIKIMAQMVSPPLREEYQFAGWLTEKGGSTLFDFNVPMTQAMNIYTSWAPIEGDVIVEGNGWAIDRYRVLTIRSEEGMEDWVTWANRDEESWGYRRGIIKGVVQSSVSKIADSVFESCFNMKSVELPDSVQTIGEDAFAYCEALKNITLPEGLQEIKASAFKACEFESVTIPKNVTKIGDEAFRWCERLTTVYMQGEPPQIGTDVFDGTDMREGSIIVPPQQLQAYQEAAGWQSLASYIKAADSGDSGNTGGGNGNNGGNEGGSGNTGENAGSESAGSDAAAGGVIGDTAGSADHSAGSGVEAAAGTGLVSVKLTDAADGSADSSDNASAGGAAQSGAKEPKTGDEAPLALYATLSMIFGLAYVLLYFADRRRGMTNEQKKELVADVIGWAKRGGSVRKAFALAVIFLILVYYHSIGKKICPDWRAVYEGNAAADGRRSDGRQIIR